MRSRINELYHRYKTFSEQISCLSTDVVISSNEVVEVVAQTSQWSFNKINDTGIKTVFVYAVHKLFNVANDAGEYSVQCYLPSYVIERPQSCKQILWIIDFGKEDFRQHFHPCFVTRFETRSDILVNPS